MLMIHFINNRCFIKFMSRKEIGGSTHVVIKNRLKNRREAKTKEQARVIIMCKEMLAVVFDLPSGGQEALRDTRPRRFFMFPSSCLRPSEVNSLFSYPA